MEMKLTGWKAIAVIAVVVGFLVFRFNMETEALQTEGAQGGRRRKARK